MSRTEASRLTACGWSERPGQSRSTGTRELDYILAATFGFWEQITPGKGPSLDILGQLEQFSRPGDQ